MQGSFVESLYNGEPAGAFAHGHLVINTPDVAKAEHDTDAGYWRCDLVHHDKLTWSTKVCELFGVPPGTTVDRAWAVAQYAEPSREALEHVRSFALSRKLGFILDAAITAEGTQDRWIRVLAVPILDNGRVVGLHGLKRAL